MSAAPCGINKQLYVNRLRTNIIKYVENLLFVIFWGNLALFALLLVADHVLI